MMENYYLFLNIGKILLAFSTFAIIGMSTRLLPVIVFFLIIACFIGSLADLGVSVEILGSVGIFLQLVASFCWTVATQNIATFITALVGFIGGASFKRDGY